MTGRGALQTSSLQQIPCAVSCDALLHMAVKLSPIPSCNRAVCPTHVVCCSHWHTHCAWAVIAPLKVVLHSSSTQGVRHVSALSILYQLLACMSVYNSAPPPTHRLRPPNSLSLGLWGVMLMRL